MKMSKVLVFAFFLLCIVALFMSAHVVRADDDGDDDDTVPEAEAGAGQHEDKAQPTDTDDEDDEPKEAKVDEPDVLGPSDNVVTTFIFPDYPDKKLPAGEKVTVLVGFSNRGQNPFNLSWIAAALHSPFDYNYYIQNFTAREVNAIVEKGEEGSIEYQFTPDKSLEPLEFHLSISLYYNDTVDDQLYVSPILNGTIELIEKSSGLDVKALFQYILAFAGLGLAGYIGLNISGSLNKGGAIERTRTRVTAPSASQQQAAAASWEHEAYKRAAPAKKKGGSKGGSGKGAKSAATS